MCLRVSGYFDQSSEPSFHSCMSPIVRISKNDAVGRRNVKSGVE